MPSRIKNRWDLSSNNLTGIPADKWWKLLKDNDFAIEPIYYHRFAFLTLLSYLNSVYHRKEQNLYASAIAETRTTQPPVFILGHYRSGTTHLHNLLAIDTEQFAFPTTFQVARPYTFLCTEETHAKRLEPFLPKKRLMDNMAQGLYLPQEDEFALSLASFCSPLLAYTFPKHYDRYFRYLTFDDATSEEIARWKETLLWFTKKLTLKYGRRLLLKSPPHTARVKLIREVFPGALFINMYRHPHTVFQSTRHLYNIIPWSMCLQNAEGAYTDERIIEQYATMYDRYFVDKKLIPSDQLHEMRFEDLEQDPLHEIARIYDRFSFGRFEAIEPKLRYYLDSISDYKKNTYPELSEPLKKKLAQEWRMCFEAWGYSIE